MKKTRRSLFTSIVTLLLCSAMFVGSTFAWFTDTVSNTGNRIQAGTLKVDLLMYKKNATDDDYSYQSIADKEGDIFKEAAVAQNSLETLWEPGKTQVVYLAVENKGNLALKYQFYIDVLDHGLCDDGEGKSSLEYIVVPGAKPETSVLTGKYADVKETASSYPSINLGDVKPGRTIMSNEGVLDEISEKGTQNETEYFALIVHMKEDAGNVYQGKDAIIDVYLTATQYTSEKDGFDNPDYDANAKYAEKEAEPVVDVVEKKVEEGKDTTYISSVTPSEETGKQTKITVPKEVAAFVADKDTTMKIEATPTVAANHKFTVSSNGAVGAIDLTVKVDNVEVSQFKDKNEQPINVTVETYVAKNLTNVSLQYNNGEGDQPTDIKYDETTGKLSFKTTHFSTFVLGANEEAYIEETNTAYLTLQKAIAAAGNVNKTIIVLKDIENTDVGYELENVNLDLNRHLIKITRTERSKPQSFGLKGDVTISNGSIETSLHSEGGSSIKALKGSNAILNNVNIKSYTTSNPDVPAYGPVVYGSYMDDPNGNMIINGGTFDCIVGTNGSTRNGSLTINDGVFNKYCYFPAYMDYVINGGIFNEELIFVSGNITISGGTFKGNEELEYFSSNNSASGGSLNLTAHNGKMKEEGYGPTPILNITGGTFAGKIGLARVDSNIDYPTVTTSGVSVETVKLGIDAVE